MTDNNMEGWFTLPTQTPGSETLTSDDFDANDMINTPPAVAPSLSLLASQDAIAPITSHTLSSPPSPVEARCSLDSVLTYGECTAEVQASMDRRTNDQSVSHPFDCLSNLSSFQIPSTTYVDAPPTVETPPPISATLSAETPPLISSTTTAEVLSTNTSTSTGRCKSISMEELCRLCLVRSEGEMQSLFADESVLDDIWALVQLELHEGDGMPDQVCQHCVYQLKSALEFISTCRSSDLMLKDYIYKLKVARSLGTVADNGTGDCLTSTADKDVTNVESPSINGDICIGLEKEGTKTDTSLSLKSIVDLRQNSILSRLLQRPPTGKSLLPPFSSSLEESFSRSSLERSYDSHVPDKSNLVEVSHTNSAQEGSVLDRNLNDTFSSDRVDSRHIEEPPCEKLHMGRREEAEDSLEDSGIELAEVNNNILSPTSMKIICVKINDPAKITNGRVVKLNQTFKVNNRLNVPMYVLANAAEKQELSNGTNLSGEITASEVDGDGRETQASDVEGPVDMEYHPRKRSTNVEDNSVDNNSRWARGLETGRHAYYLKHVKGKEMKGMILPQRKLIRSFFLDNHNFDAANEKDICDNYARNSTNVDAAGRFGKSTICRQLLSRDFSARINQAVTVCVTSTDSVSAGKEETRQEAQRDSGDEEAPPENGAEDFIVEDSTTEAGVENNDQGSESVDGVQYVMYGEENGDAETYIVPDIEPCTESSAAKPAFGNSELLFFDVQEEVVVETDDVGDETEEVLAVEVQPIMDQADPEPGVSGEYVYEVKTEPTDEYPFVCETCGKAFKRRNALLSHMKLHTFINFGNDHEQRKNVYKCDVCFKNYISKTGLNMHRSRVHETGSVPCPECDQSFPSRSQLAAHLKVHSQREYKCNRCFKTFQKRKTFVAHTQLHVQIIYKCDTCLRMFNMEEELNEHVKTHQDQEAATGSAQAPAARSDAQVEQFQRMKFEYCLSYVGLVKSMFANQPEMYAGFLDTIKDFKFQKINVQGLLVRISQLFKDHRELIAGFNTFMPHGFKIELPPDDKCNPDGSVLVEEPAQGPDMDLDYSLSYLSQIKSMFANQPKIYNDFTYIIKEYKLQTMDIPEVIRRVSHLFRNYPELIAGFNSFLPPWCKIKVNGKEKKEKEDIDPLDTTQPGTSTEPAPAPCNGDSKRKVKRKSSSATHASDAAKRIKMELSGSDSVEVGDVAYITEAGVQVQVKTENEAAEEGESEAFIVETAEGDENRTYAHDGAEGEPYLLESGEDQQASTTEEFFITVSNDVGPTTTTGICSFVCHVCLQTFKQRGTLHNHMKTHGK